MRETTSRKCAVLRPLVSHVKAVASPSCMVRLAVALFDKPIRVILEKGIVRRAGKRDEPQARRQTGCSDMAVAFIPPG